jgi:hypothetical protein
MLWQFYAARQGGNAPSGLPTANRRSMMAANPPRFGDQSNAASGSKKSEEAMSVAK